jgi:hypothetical protein
MILGKLTVYQGTFSSFTNKGNLSCLTESFNSRLSRLQVGPISARQKELEALVCRIINSMMDPTQPNRKA